jgi:hypothetical protein
MLYGVWCTSRGRLVLCRPEAEHAPVLCCYAVVPSCRLLPLPAVCGVHSLAMAVARLGWSPPSFVINMVWIPASWTALILWASVPNSIDIFEVSVR